MGLASVIKDSIRWGIVVGIVAGSACIIILAPMEAFDLETSSLFLTVPLWVIVNMRIWKWYNPFPPEDSQETLDRQARSRELDRFILKHIEENGMGFDEAVTEAQAQGFADAHRLHGIPDYNKHRIEAQCFRAGLERARADKERLPHQDDPPQP